MTSASSNLNFGSLGSTSREGEAATIADLAIASAEPTVIQPAPDEVFMVTTPAGHQTQVIDLEYKLHAPVRKMGRQALHDATSLSAYVNRHKTSHTQLYKNDIDCTPTITVVINDHDTDATGWGDHIAVLAVVRTKAWSAWLEKDGKYLTQTEFAEFIENQVDDIREPSGAEMLELAQTFQAKTKVDFQSGTRLQDGQQQLTYNEDIQASGGSKGEMTIPTAIGLGIKPFEGSEAFAVSARFRFRIRDGRLTLAYILNKPEDIERAAFNDVVAEVEQATELTALYGVAPL